MRPIRLELLGFGPYRERAEISFEEVELFAITGPTGSGKTTILDAIAFALYNKTPRIARGYGDLRHPAALETRVVLEFSVGNEAYRVTRVLGKRNEHRLERLDGDWRVLPESERVKEMNAAIERIVGLPYEAFTRAVLLPQGEFDRFLKGEPKERRALLASLFGLETLAAMRELASSRRQAILEERSRIEGEIAALGSGEDLGALEDELAKLEAADHNERKRLSRLRRELEDAERRHERFGQLEAARRELSALQARSEEIERLRQRLVQARVAARLLPELDRLQADALELERRRKEHERLKARLEQLERERAKLGELASQARLAEIQNELAEAKRLQELARWRAKLGAPAAAVPARPFDPVRVGEILEVLKAYEDLEREAQDLRKMRAEHRGQLHEVERLERTVQDLKKKQQALKAEGQAARARYETLKKRLEDARTHAGLKAYHRLLKAGAPCPLCGQVVTELPRAPGSDVDLSELERDTQQAQERLDALREAYQALRAKLGEAEGRLGALKEAVARGEAALSEAQAALEAKRSELLRRGDRDTLKIELEGQKQGLLKALGEEDPAERQRRLENERRAIERALGQQKTLDETLAAVLQELHGLEGIIAEAEKVYARDQARLAGLLKDSGFDSADALRRVAMSEQAIAALEAELDRWQQALTRAEVQLQALERELAGETPPDPARLAELRAEVEALEAASGKRQRQLGALREKLDRARVLARRRKDLTKRLADLGRQLSIWQRLSEDLRSDRFPDYLIEHYQRGLVARASELLATLYQGRYRLISADGDYLVEDTWTAARRPVRTLSGGESFLASLSLALALSEHLSRGRLEALFLDEGFGTLDQETLEVVTTVLEDLPTRGRLVGIVTHVEELAERMPARLVVEKSPSGSRVRWSD